MIRSCAFFESCFRLCWFQSLATELLKSTLILLSSTSAPSILLYAIIHASSVSNSTNAYYRESPVFQSLITSHDTTLPNLEKIISRSSDYVTGFNLQTNNTFFGGSISASGRSSRIVRTCALFLASTASLSY